MKSISNEGARESLSSVVNAYFDRVLEDVSEQRNCLGSGYRSSPSILSEESQEVSPLRATKAMAQPLARQRRASQTPLRPCVSRPSRWR